MNVIWTPLTEEELAALKEGDPVVTHTGSKGAFQFHPAQRLHPEFFYIRTGKFAKRDPKDVSVLVLREGDDRPMWEAATHVGRFIPILVNSPVAET